MSKNSGAHSGQRTNKRAFQKSQKQQQKAQRRGERLKDAELKLGEGTPMVASEPLHESDFEVGPNGGLIFRTKVGKER